MKFFAGIGSRKTPDDIQKKMVSISRAFCNKGYILRSGGSVGADRAFEEGASEKEIFLSKDATPKSISLAMKYHPNPKALMSRDSYTIGLIGRNMQIVLGKNLDSPVEFVVCWTENGRVTGGTGYALKLCLDKNIKIYNLALESDLCELREVYQSL